MDRSQFDNILYCFTPGGSYHIHVPGEPAPGSVLSGPFIEPYEEISEDMTEAERQ